MRRSLLTKAINKEQESLAHEYGLNIISKLFSKVTLVFDTVDVPKADVWIITSTNAARYLSVHFEDIPKDVYPNYLVCLDAYTAENVKQLGINIKMPEYGTIDNVIQLVKDLKIDSAIYFSGNNRSKSIPNELQEILDFSEFQVYHSETIEEVINMNEIEAIAFFSPEDVKGFGINNQIKGQAVIAVNTITKKAVDKHLGIRAGIAASHSIEDILFALKEVTN